PPLFFMSFIIDGASKMIDTFSHISWQSIFSLFYIVYISTLVGYGAWNWLLSRYSVITIAPFTLLIPVVGVLTSVIFFGEPFQTWKFFAVLLVVTGLFINLLGPRFLGNRVDKKLKAIIAETN